MVRLYMVYGKTKEQPGLTSKQLRQKFLAFFADKKHVSVPSSSLTNSGDPSVLLTTAGMQQFKPYLMGKADPVKIFKSKNVFTIQKCFRTTDIDEVGDNSHLTFFEMVGNFSFGGYFKETAIPTSFEFITSPKGLNLNPEKLYVTAFKGDDQVPRDDEAIRLWQAQFNKVGINAKIGERIFLYGREKNWWEAGPGPCGPDAEMFFDLGKPHNVRFGPTCHPNCDCGRFIEIGNDVFVQYNKTADNRYEPLTHKGIDNGRGFERLVMVAQGKESIFETDLFLPLIRIVDSAKTRHGLPKELEGKASRIITDHMRGATFLMAEGLAPSNVKAGYVLRRVLRRAIRFAHTLDLPYEVFNQLIKTTASMYVDAYPELRKNLSFIQQTFQKEYQVFGKTLKKGMAAFEKTISSTKNDVFPGQQAFFLFSSYGFPLELIEEMLKERQMTLEQQGFAEALALHREKSRP